MRSLIILLILSTHFCFGQSTNITESIQEVNFSEDTISSVFLWVTDNIKYDVKKLNAIKDGSISNKNPKFKTEEESKAYKLETVLKLKRGVCEDYALLFNTMVQELGYEAYVVEGYTKKKGKINRKVGHVWNAVKVNQEWKLFDATWAAGHVVDGKKFVKRYSEQWNDVDPKEMIKSHMPFDPVWQLLTKPITYNSFEQGVFDSYLKEDYQFMALIDDYGKKERKIQLKDQVSRSEELGDGISMIERWRQRKTKQSGFFEVRNQRSLIEETHQKSQIAVDLFNKYIEARAKQFKGSRYTVEIAEGNLMAAKKQIEAVIETYRGIDIENTKAKNNLNKAISHSESLLRNIKKEEGIFAKYKSRK